MLQHLSVKNLAIVEEASIFFGKGLNIITGETGAGKSVLMGALNLVLGQRADKTTIRTGADEARVEALFTLASTNTIDTLLIERDIPACEEGQLLIKRTISLQGPGRTYINDSPVTQQSLRAIAPLLVDIHGPYDQQSLLKPEFQRSLLDAYGACVTPLKAYRKSWYALKELKSELNEITSDTIDIAEEIDRLNYIIGEIKDASLTEADGDELIEQHTQAANAETIISIGSEISESIIESDISAFNQMLEAQAKSNELSRIFPEAEKWLTDIKSSILQMQEIGSTIADHLSRIETAPGHLQQLEDRMALVQNLKRKYGGSIQAIHESLAIHEERHNNLFNRTEKIEDLQNRINAERADLLKRASTLTKSRKKATSKLGKAITDALQDLGFLNAEFTIAIKAASPASHGADEIIFEFAPNPGEPPRPLKAIASSGEIARVMLAVKAVLATHDSIPVLVFDEIDANIGGEVGRAVGQKLKHVAKSHQVISITHLPQSAVYGEQHVKVSKEVVNKRTKMTAEILNPEQRVDEIARMLGGKGLTSVIENHAREMLESATAGH
ncbi:MAG: DNA repair protein RecN [Kiritimatiellae bacterium]|jgi:DNA repair protein RecN (Recombination protein N)|nr:DNA repair protein RecN [Kiritimatiellia bacterium]